MNLTPSEQRKFDFARAQVKLLRYEKRLATITALFSVLRKRPTLAESIARWERRGNVG